jgi:hypothetical protein
MRSLTAACLALATGSATAVLAAQTSATTAPPPTASAIEDLGHYAEDAYDRAKITDWAKERGSLEALKAAAGRLGPAERKDAILARQLDGAISALEKAVSSRDKPAAMREANLLTRLAAEISRPSKPPVPVDVTLLDYYGRELEIWASARDEAKLRSTAADMGKTWRRLRPQVVARGGSGVASRFDALVKAAESTSSVDGLARLATPILDEVDNLEKVFTGVGHGA